MAPTLEAVAGRAHAQEHVAAAPDDSEAASAPNAESAASQYERFGSASPWASDPWEAATAPVEEGGSEEDLALLSSDSVAIPTSEQERASTSQVGQILGAYESLLQRRSARHLGYPYNLDYQNDALAGFMRYSINNLGDPFVPSNYGVHSRQFEVAVVQRQVVFGGNFGSNRFFPLFWVNLHVL